MGNRTIAKTSLGLLAAGLATLILTTLVFADHWRVVALEQVILSPWLGPHYLGDGGPAEGLLLCNPMDLELTPAGEVLVSDRGRGRRGRVVWRIDHDGIAHIVAGTGRRGKADAGSADAISFERPESMAVTRDGGFYISDGFNHKVLYIAEDGSVTRVAGTGTAGFSGDGGPADEAMLHRPADLHLDSIGNLYIADVRNHRVRKIDRWGVIATVVGTGRMAFSPDGTLASEAHLDTPWGIAVDHQDRLLIGDGGNHRIRRVEDDGRLVTIAGNGRRGFDGDGGPATEASLNFPEAMKFDAQGGLFFGDELNHAVRVLEPDGRIWTLIGTGVPDRAVLGARAAGSPLSDPESVLVTPDGELLIADGENGRVLRISSDGIVRLFAGRGDVAPCAALW